MNNFTENMFDNGAYRMFWFFVLYNQSYAVIHKYGYNLYLNLKVPYFEFF